MLHPITGARDSVLAATKNAADAFTENNPIVQQKLQEAYPDDVEREQARQKIIDNLNQAYSAATQATTDPKWFAPQDAMAGIVQSAMNERAREGAPAAASATAGEMAPLAIAEAPLEQFGPLDPGWVECIVDSFKTLFEGKAPFVQHQALTDFLHPIPDQITIALVADWAASNDAAALVAAQIRAARPDIVIHLGDIYYAGQENEALAALRMWPLADPATAAIAPATSFALNGNHEMYSGGKAYFNTMLNAFGQKASYFGLRNKNWQILAFDSAYADHRLLPPAEATGSLSRLRSQWDWLVDKMRAPALSTILLSHHQPVSAFAQENGEAVNLRSDFETFANAAGQPVFGWFFGHEHRCTVYDDQDVPYFARLIGHGSIPHTPPPPDQQPEPGCTKFSRMNTRAKANGDAVSGFALLKMDGPLIDIQYIDEDGIQFFEESWQAIAL